MFYSCILSCIAISILYRVYADHETIGELKNAKNIFLYSGTDHYFTTFYKSIVYNLRLKITEN